MLYLGLYYAAVAVFYVVLAVSSEKSAASASYILTPAAVFSHDQGLLSLSALCGIVLQLMIIAFLIATIRGRVQRTRLFAAAAAD